MTPERLSRSHIWSLAVASVLAVGIIHWRTLFIGLQPDTLLCVRPWTMAELQRSLAGTWLFPNVDLYHRPLATLIFWAGFTAFGLNSWALHATSLLMLVGTCWLLGGWLAREAGITVALSVMAFYLTHPVLLDSTIAGPQYHFHLIPLVLVAGTVRLWVARRSGRTLAAWWPILALPVVGFYAKEDTIMIVPVLLVLQALRARLFGDVAWPSRAVLGASAILAIILCAIRWSIFPHFETVGGFASRVGYEGLRIAVYAPARTAFGMFFRGDILLGTTALVLLLQVAGAVRAWRSPRSPAGWTWICGLVMLIAFCAPLTITAEIRSTRLHLAVFSAAIMLGAGGIALIDWAASRWSWGRRVAITMLVVAIGAQWNVQSLTRNQRFLSCSSEQLIANSYAATWPEITPDLRRWLANMPSICTRDGSASPEASLDSMRWSNPESDVVLVHRTAADVTLVFDAPPQDTAVTVVVDGDRRAHVIEAAASTITIPLTPTWRTWLRRDFRIDVRPTEIGGALPQLHDVRVRRHP